MVIERSPMLKLDTSQVVGYLKSAGSRDPDILHTQRTHLMSLARFPKLVGTYLMVVGGLCTALILLAVVGIPLLLFGWWMRRRGVKNIRVVETGWAEFVRTPPSDLEGEGAMHRRVAITVILLLSCALAQAAEIHPVRFEPNRGQVDPRAKYVARTPEGILSLESGQVHLGDAVLGLVGASPDAGWEAVEPLPGRSHYLLGTDQILDVPTYGAVVMRSAYPGIDVVIRGNDERVDVDFVVAPKADTAAIGLALDGMGWRLAAPQVDGVPRGYRLAGGATRIDGPSAAGLVRVSLERSEPEKMSDAPRLAADAEGNLYVAGHVAGGRATAFVTELDPKGQEVRRTTYVDGLDVEAPLALAVSPAGEIALAGTSRGDAAVVRLDRNGRAIAGRAALGGSGDDTALAVALASDGTVWLAGRTTGSGFIAAIDGTGSTLFATSFGDEVRGLALDRDGNVYATGSAGPDAFVAKLNSRTRTPEYFTPFGGSGADTGSAIAVSSSGEPVVVGTTASPDLPIVGGKQGPPNAFLARWDRTGRSLIFSTYLGGATDATELAVALDRGDRAWVAGSRGTGDAAHVFVSRIARSADEKAIDRTLAGDRRDVATGLLVNGNGDAVVAGLTQSRELPDADRPESAAGGEVFTTIVPGGDAPSGVCPGTRNFTGFHSSAWEDAMNWSGGSLPTSTDDVCIDGFNVVLGSGNQSAGTLHVQGGSLTMTNGQLTVAGASEISNLTVTFGTLTGAGNITVSGGFSWTGGTLSGAGILTTTGTSSLSGTGAKGLLSRRWDANGPVTFTGTGNLNISSAAVINTSSTWDCQSDAPIVWAVGAATAVNNSGTFKKSAGAGTTTVQAPFNNTGSVVIQSGSMNLSNGGSSSGSFDLGLSHTVQFGGLTFSLGAGTTFAGSGSILLSASTLSVDTSIAVPAAISFDMTGGILTGTGTLTTAGPLNYSGGTMQSSGITTCNGALNVSGTNAKGIQLARVLNTNATTNYTATGAGNLTVSTSSVINNAGTWDFQGDGSVVWGVGSAPSFNNTGTVKKSSGTGTSNVGLPFVHDGIVLVQTGTLNVNQGGSSTGSFDTAAGTTLQFGGGTFNVNAGTTFTGSGDVLLSSTTLSINAAIGIPATVPFDMTGGILTGTGTLTTAGPLNFSGGTMQSSGVTTCNGPLNISGAAAKGIQTARTINNNATANFMAGSSNLIVSSSTVINNVGTWDFQGDGSVVWGVSGAPSFDNTGTVKKSGGTGTSNMQVPFVNDGIVLVQTGTLNVNQGGSSTGSFDVASGTTLQWGGGTFNWNAGTTFTGLGRTLLSAAGINVNAAIGTPATMTFDMTGGTINGTGTLTTGGTFNWSAGSFNNAGTTTFNGALNIGPGGSKGITTRVLNSNLLATWTDTFTIAMSSGGVINNNGTWECLTDAAIGWGVGGAPAFRNFGTFRKSAGTGATTLSLPTTNTGTVEVQSGTISVNNYTQTAGTTKLTGGAFTDTTTIAIQGGTLAGSGTVTGPVVVSGTGALSPGLSPGALSLPTSYVQQAPSGAFNVELGGTAPAQYDRAAVGGAATLAGILNVTLINGFVPQPGDTFTIMTYASHTGTFTQVLPSTGCIGWRVDYGPTALVLTAAAVPEEISGVSFTSKSALSWNPAPIYAATTYNVLRGDLDKLPVGPGADETCADPGTTATTSTDAATPTPGHGFWYLVRERVTSCGAGTYGFATGGAERVSTACAP